MSSEHLFTKSSLETIEYRQELIRRVRLAINHQEPLSEGNKQLILDNLNTTSKLENYQGNLEALAPWCNQGYLIGMLPSNVSCDVANDQGEISIVACTYTATSQDRRQILSGQHAETALTPADIPLTVILCYLTAKDKLESEL